MLWAFLRTLLAHCAPVSRGTHGQLAARATSSAVGGDDGLFNKQAPLSSQLLCKLQILTVLYSVQFREMYLYF